MKTLAHRKNNYILYNKKMEINNLEKINTHYSQYIFTTFENRTVYIRYTNGYLTILISNPNKNIYDTLKKGKKIFGNQLGNKSDEVIEWKTVEKIIKQLPNSINDINNYVKNNN